jgi:uncharacterized membrane protein
VNQFNASLWGDEAFSAILSMKPVFRIIEIIINDTSPPLYNLTEHFWFGLFGSGEVAIRSLSFLYYCLACFFVLLIGKVVWNWRTGLVACGLAFFNPFFFTYAFEGRMYSILALGVCASMYFFVELVWGGEKRKAWPWILGYSLSSAWALYSHHFSIFALMVAGGWFLWEGMFGSRKVAGRLFWGFVGAGVLYLPWVWPLYKQTKMVGGGFWLGTPTLQDLLSVLLEYLAVGIKHPLAKWALGVSVVSLILRRWIRGKEEIKKDAFLLSWFLGPVILAWLVSQKFQSVFFNRYLLYVIPAVSLIVAGGRRAKLGVMLVGVLLGLFMVIDWWYFVHPTKRPFLIFSEHVKTELRGDDYLINWNGGSHHLWETKYYGIPAPIYIPEGSGDLPFFVGTALMEKEDIISEIPKGVYRVGAVTSGSIEEIEVAGYTEVDRYQIGELKLVWLQKD